MALKRRKTTRVRWLTPNPPSEPVAGGCDDMPSPPCTCGRAREPSTGDFIPLPHICQVSLVMDLRHERLAPAPPAAPRFGAVERCHLRPGPPGPPTCMLEVGGRFRIHRRQMNDARRLMSTLPHGPLGRTGLDVTRLGYGAMEVRGSRIWGGRPVEDAEAETILNAVLDRASPSSTRPTTTAAARSTSDATSRTSRRVRAGHQVRLHRRP